MIHGTFEVFMRNRQRGFTLIEIMVVVVILAVLGALVVPNILGKVDTARVTAAKTDINSIKQALDLYRLDNFKYPGSHHHQLSGPRVLIDAAQGSLGQSVCLCEPGFGWPRV
jgi:prepilin-type N-terminal cleavage/methylation domain-containing protein